MPIPRLDWDVLSGRVRCENADAHDRAKTSEEHRLRSRTERLTQCPKCGLFVIWEPRDPN